VLMVPCVTTSMVMARTLGVTRTASIVGLVIAMTIGVGSLTHLVWP